MKTNKPADNGHQITGTASPMVHLFVTLKMLGGEQRQVHVDFLYPPDSTPPQVLMVRTEG